MSIDTSAPMKEERLSRKELELEERRRERKENMNPPDDQPFSRLACAVIYSVAKNWRHSGNPDRDKIANRHVVDFFTGPDYMFWRNFTGIKVDGADIVAALAENGRIQMPFQIIHADWGSEKGAV